MQHMENVVLMLSGSGLLLQYFRLQHRRNSGQQGYYLQRMRYTGNRIVYSTGNIYSLASNPPDYVKDRTYGSFTVDLVNQTIEKLDLPYLNGMAACLAIYPSSKNYYSSQ
jgi:hypothetical protein